MAEEATNENDLALVVKFMRGRVGEEPMRRSGRNLAALGSRRHAGKNGLRRALVCPDEPLHSAVNFGEELPRAGDGRVG